jgi:acyl carrier protein
MLAEDLRLDVMQEVLRLLDETLSLSGRATSFKADTVLLGSVPELDSMAVVSVITGLEDRFGIVIDDDDIDGDTFATVGSLVEFVKGKVGA